MISAARNSAQVASVEHAGHAAGAVTLLQSENGCMLEALASAPFHVPMRPRVQQGSEVDAPILQQNTKAPTIQQTHQTQLRLAPPTSARSLWHTLRLSNLCSHKSALQSKAPLV